MTDAEFPKYMTAERVGHEYHVKIKGNLSLVFVSLEDFLEGVKLLISMDPANDGPEVGIIQREKVLSLQDENFDGIAWG